MSERRIDLNADVGEGCDDEPLFALVSSVNVACGGHAGNEATMRAAVDAAIAHGCAIGAHPGFEDREHFGRRAMRLADEDITALVATQVHDLIRVAESAGATLRHVKPHGALYNQAAADAALARAVVAGVAAAGGSLAVVGPPRSALLDAASAAGLATIAEGFCDRGYRADGSLVPRGEPGALVEDPDVAADRALAMATGRPVVAAGGAGIIVEARTLCIHADTPGAIRIARAVRAALDRNGVVVAPV